MKRKIALLLMCVLFVLSLTACSASESDYIVSDNRELSEADALVPINSSNYLYYDVQTRIIYIVTAECRGYDGYGFMSPYYSENGNLCRYVDGEIVELKNSAVITPGIPDDEQSEDENGMTAITKEDIQKKSSCQYKLINGDLYYDTGNLVVYQLKDNYFVIYTDGSLNSYQYIDDTLVPFILK